MSQNDTAFVRVMQQYFDKGLTSAPPLVTHAPPDWAPPSPAQGVGPRRLIVTTGGVTIHLDGWNSILSLMLANRDPLNFVELIWTYTDATPTAHINKIKLYAGASAVIPGPVTLASNLLLTADTASCLVDYSIIGT